MAKKLERHEKQFVLSRPEPEKPEPKKKKKPTEEREGEINKNRMMIINNIFYYTFHLRDFTRSFQKTWISWSGN